MLRRKVKLYIECNVMLQIDVSYMLSPPRRKARDSICGNVPPIHPNWFQDLWVPNFSWFEKMIWTSVARDCISYDVHNIFVTPASRERLKILISGHRSNDLERADRIPEPSFT